MQVNMATEKKQFSCENKSSSEPDEVYTGSGKYPWQHVPKSYLDKQQEEEK